VEGYRRWLKTLNPLKTCFETIYWLENDTEFKKIQKFRKKSKKNPKKFQNNSGKNPRMARIFDKFSTGVICT